jgi:hypothetical protein
MKIETPLQSQTKKYKEAYQSLEKRKVQVHINVDSELADIIREMKKDSFTDRAIRGYARAFLGWD